MTKTIRFFIPLLLFGVNLLQAQDRIIKVTHTPQQWDNVSFALCYSNENVVYNIGSYEVCRPGKVYDIAISPACNSFITLAAQGKGKSVVLFSYTDGSTIRKFKLSEEPTAICFAPNAKYIGIADKSRVINIYDIKNFAVQYSIATSFAAQQISISNNNYFVAGANEDRVYVWNMETGKERKTLEIESFVNKVYFSNDNSKEIKNLIKKYC